MHMGMWVSGWDIRGTGGPGSQDLGHFIYLQTF